MADFVYNKAKTGILNGTIDLLADPVKLGLSSSTHVPNADDAFLDIATATDYSTGELNGTGHVGGFGGAGRKTLASKTIVQDDVNDRAEFSCADVTWTGFDAGTAAQATLLKEVTTDADSIPIGNIDSGGFPKTGNSGDLSFGVNAEGLVQLG